MIQPHEILTISFPTWNNLKYLKLFHKALRQNSRDKEIELVLHINEGSDGTLEWAQEQGIRHTHSEENLGISVPMNQAQSLVNTEWTVLLADDIYVLPDWDIALVRMLEHFGRTDNLWVAPRLIEPVNCFAPQEHPYCSIANYGQNIDTFEEERLLTEYKQYLTNSVKKLPNGNMAIKTSVYRDLDGYDTEYIFGADSDFTYRFFQKQGSKGFKQLGNSLAYHFGSIVSDSNRERKEQANKQSIERFMEKHGFFVGDLTKVIVTSEE
jgi:glycosyltransferase involved in cell wall biosynthesis